MQKPSRRSRLLWVLPPVAFLAALLLWFVAECVRGAAFPEPWNAPAHSQWISFPFEILVAASALVLAGAPFVAAIRRRGGAAALLFASWIPCFIAFFFIGFMSGRDSQNRWDRFADRLEIPEGLDVSEPVGKSEAPDIGFAALPADSADAAALCLRDYGMGCYAAAIFLRTAEPGRIRLRAVEVTTGHSLSPYELDEKTSRDHAGGDALFNGLEFIVGEGDLVHPYAARFEVCFRPASGGPERTIGSRVYRIVGSQF